MAIRRRGHARFTPTYRQLPTKSARQIGKEIREHTGMTTEQYKNYYNRIRNQIRNWERDIGTDKPIDVSQFLADIDRRQRRAERRGEAVQYTAEQQQILGYTSVSTARETTASRAARAVDLLTGENGAFKNLLEQSTYVREHFEEYRKAVNETEGREPTAAEINNELKRLADEIHALRKSQAAAGQRFYSKNGRRSRS